MLASILLITSSVAAEFCHDHKEYRIKDWREVPDLYLNELDCLFESGLVPNSIPLGMMYEKALTIGTATAIGNLTSSMLTQGSFIYSTLCQDIDTSIVEERMGGVTVGLGKVSIGTLDREVSTFESWLDQPGLLFDFTTDLYPSCGMHESISPFGRYPLLFFGGLAKSNTYPSNLYIRMLRVIGRPNDSEAGSPLLLLARTFIRDPEDPTASLITAGYSLYFTSDLNVAPEFMIEDSIISGLIAGDSISEIDVASVVDRSNPLTYLQSKLRGRNYNGEKFLLNTVTSQWASFMAKLKLLPISNA